MIRSIKQYTVEPGIAGKQEKLVTPCGAIPQNSETAAQVGIWYMRTKTYFDGAGRQIVYYIDIICPKNVLYTSNKLDFTAFLSQTMR